MPQKCEYLIIGQGLAGSLLCQELLDEGKSVVVIDNHHKGASSKIAAGIINPITGRRFVKSWMIDELLPFSEKRFAQLSSLLQLEPLFRKREILRVLFSQLEETDWLIRTAQDGWNNYVNEVADLGEFEKHLHPGFSQGAILGAQVDLNRFLIHYRTFLNDQNILIDKELIAEEVRFDTKRISSLDLEFEKIIWCQGARAKNNPLWNFIDFEPAKGEVFHLKIPGLKTNRLLKHKMMLAPLENDLFWFGSNYEWNAPDDSPSEMGERFLKKRLDKMLLNYEIIDHLAAIRPTIKDRRPVLGSHPDYENCFIFNGLGTKGASLGPFFANIFKNFLINQETFEPEINVKRFYPDR